MARTSRTSSKKKAAPKVPIAPNPNRFDPVGLEWDNAKGSSAAGESSITVEGETDIPLKIYLHIYREDNGTFKPTTRLTVEHEGAGEEWYEIADVIPDGIGGLDVSIQGMNINPKATLDASGPTSDLIAMCGLDHLALKRLAALAASADARLAEELARQVPELPALMRGIEEVIWRPR